MTMKEYQVIYKFSDVIQGIEAESLEEAQELADGLLEGEQSPQYDTACYEVEVEEIKWDCITIKQAEEQNI